MGTVKERIQLTGSAYYIDFEITVAETDAESRPSAKTAAFATQQNRKS